MTFAFGKYRGASFQHVFEQDKSYVSWALRRENPSGQLQEFVRFCAAQRQISSPGTPVHTPIRERSFSPSPVRQVRRRTDALEAIQAIPNSMSLSALAADTQYHVWAIVCQDEWKGHQIFLDSGARGSSSTGRPSGGRGYTSDALPSQGCRRLKYMRHFKVHGGAITAVPGPGDKNQWVSFEWNDIEAIILFKARPVIFARTATDEFLPSAVGVLHCEGQAVFRLYKSVSCLPIPCYCLQQCSE